METKAIEVFFTTATFYGLVISTLSSWSNLFFLQSKFWSMISKVVSIFSTSSIILLLVTRWSYGKYFPLSNLYESILFLSAILLICQQLAEIKLSTRLIRCLNLPLVLCLYWFGISGLPKEMRTVTGLAPSLQSNWLMMHVSVMMVSYGTLILGSLLSLLFLLLNIILLKTENSSSMNSFYSSEQNQNFQLTNIQQSLQTSLLKVIDTWSYRLIGLGFPFLTLGIISGAVWANEAWGAYWSWDPKESWALITWLTFAIYLHARLIKGWTGKKAAIIGGIGFIIIWICYLGVNFLGKGLHSYGWIS
uniref:Cytochrome c biogenesis protein CcsA n=1 Tax=Pseudellipsoidion edaphicum TaxID=1431838 RepID=A0A3R5WXJ8_9STRA|nr:heme attachment to plastid cytochrome c [Pseudellipsoidion edaphicum]QAA12027.1 heme attachment to plastid cytochrome c [Pseudellipsoidion edaphicum]